MSVFFFGHVKSCEYTIFLIGTFRESTKTSCFLVDAIAAAITPPMLPVAPAIATRVMMKDV